MDGTTSYCYDALTHQIVLEGSQHTVARDVTPEHGLLLAAAPLFKVACEKIETILGLDSMSAAERCEAGRDLLGLLLESYQREEIRTLPDVA